MTGYNGDHLWRMFAAIIAMAVLLFATLVWLLMITHGVKAQSSGMRCPACADNAGWTLYEFMRLDNGFLQQSLSSHSTADGCVKRFEERDKWYHQAPVVAARCVFVNRTQPPIELMKEPPDVADWPLRAR